MSKNKPDLFASGCCTPYYLIYIGINSLKDWVKRVCAFACIYVNIYKCIAGWHILNFREITRRYNAMMTDEITSAANKKNRAVKTTIDYYMSYNTCFYFLFTRVWFFRFLCVIVSNRNNAGENATANVDDC